MNSKRKVDESKRVGIIMDQEKKSKMLKSYSTKKLNLKKKASELSTLCETDTFMIGYGPCGDFFTWPENQNQLDTLIERYKSIDITDRMKYSTSLSHSQHLTRNDFQTKEINHQTQSVKNPQLLFPVSGDDDDYDGFTKTLTTEESLREFQALLESKLQQVKEKKLELSKGKKKPKTDDGSKYIGLVRENQHHTTTHLPSGGSIFHRPIHHVSATSSWNGRNLATCNCSSSRHYCQPQPLTTCLPELVAQHSSPTSTIVIDDDDDDEPEPASSFTLELKI